MTTEQEFQQVLRTAVTRAKLPLKLWRQPAGRFETRRGGFVEAAPVGAADLSGIVTTGVGVRVELELKGARTEVTEDQLQWEENHRRWGAAYARHRFNARESLEDNVARVVTDLRALCDVYGCTHPDAAVVLHPAGGAWCTRCGWRSGGREREVP